MSNEVAPIYVVSVVLDLVAALVDLLDALSSGTPEELAIAKAQAHTVLARARGES